jgi:hypothetical protein
MAQLAANRPVPNPLQQRLDLAGGVVVDMVCTTGTTIYEGAFVGYIPGTGLIHPLVDADCFAGIALKGITVSAAGAKIPVFIDGYFQHAVTSSASTSIGYGVFGTSGSTDNVLDIASTAMPCVGRVANWVTGTTCVIKMKTSGQPVGRSDAVTIGWAPIEG